MKSVFKKLLSFCIAISMCCVMCATAFATDNSSKTILGDEPSKIAQPRIGIAGYNNHYHDGSTYYGEFTVTTSSVLLPMKQFSVELNSFDSDTWIVIDIYNSKGQSMLGMSFSVEGNGMWENKALNPLYFTNGDTYTIRYNVYNDNGSILSGDDGWLAIWIY